jgi:hypothetical protein
MIAFHAGDARRLPDDEELYDWAKAALRTSRFGVSVALLAWAFAERGDAEMAGHMLREAPTRLATEFLPESAPRLSKWLDDKLAALPVVTDDDL